MRRLLLVAPMMLALAAGITASGAAAQEAPVPDKPAPFLTVDQDRLFAESLWGKRAAGEIEKASRDLQAENRKIESALTAEEKALTEKRSQMAAEDFRKLADEFDSRVAGIRQAQEAKARAVSDQRDRERQAFFEAALPIMGEVMAARGAVAILDNRAIFLSVRAIDVTDAVLKRIDEKLGAGPAAGAGTGN